MRARVCAQTPQNALASFDECRAASGAINLVNTVRHSCARPLHTLTRKLYARYATALRVEECELEWIGAQ